MCDEPDAGFTLVHGRVGPNMIGHAWIDLNDGRVYDPVRDEYVVAKDYAAFMGGAVADHRYTQATSDGGIGRHPTLRTMGITARKRGAFSRDVAPAIDVAHAGETAEPKARYRISAASGAVPISIIERDGVWGDMARD